MVVDGAGDGALLVPFGSNVPLVTLAVLLTIGLTAPVLFTVTISVRCQSPPLPSVVFLHETVPRKLMPGSVHLTTKSLEIELKLVPLGTSSVKTTFEAASGPALWIVNW